MALPDAPSTLLQRGYDPSEPSEVAFTVHVASGPDQGMTVTVDDSEPAHTLVGSSPACGLRLRDKHVSRRHLALDIVGGGLRVADLDSTNGTRVNGLKIREALLVGGERIHVGETVLAVEAATKNADAQASFATHFDRVLGSSREMRRLYPLCERIAASAVPVIIEGETGTGKEVLAEALHARGPRAAGPFVVFDCTSVAPSLVEAELFGHERGAFTGANAAHRGVFEQANGGTLLIDEIGDMELHLQPKLLRAIERSEFRRVGGEKTIRVDVRVMAATRRDLDREIEAKRFRDDLFHRLAVARIELPPLRERRGDVTELAVAFCREVHADPNALLRSEVFARWQSYRWPGNVRELRNAVARFVALGELGDFAEHHGPEVPAEGGADFIAQVLAQGLTLAAARKAVVEHFEQLYIDAVLKKHDGVVTHAAKAAGIARRHFYRVGRGGSSNE